MMIYAVYLIIAASVDWCSIRASEYVDIMEKHTTLSGAFIGGVVLSAVGCVSRAVLRDASGVTVRTVDEPCEIVSLNGTVSAVRCHLHLALSKEDLSTVGGHLMPGCIINTTCELVLARLDGWRFGVEQDAQTGYDELVFHRTGTEEEP